MPTSEGYPTDLPSAYLAPEGGSADPCQDSRRPPGRVAAQGKGPKAGEVGSNPLQPSPRGSWEAGGSKRKTKRKPKPPSAPQPQGRLRNEEVLVVGGKGARFTPERRRRVATLTGTKPGSRPEREREKAMRTETKRQAAPRCLNNPPRFPTHSAPHSAPQPTTRLPAQPRLRARKRANVHRSAPSPSIGGQPRRARQPARQPKQPGKQPSGRLRG